MKKRDFKSLQKAKPVPKTGNDGLKSSKFRFLNEQLYTTESKSAVNIFKQAPELFEDYHAGYRQQVEKWPDNPLSMLIKKLQKSERVQANVADFGCGEGRLELELKQSGHKGSIFSFDVGKCASHII